MLGSKLVGFALTWWLTEETGSAAVLATSNLMNLLPDVVLGPVVGALIDRWSRRWTMIIADGAIALCTAALAYLFNELTFAPLGAILQSVVPPEMQGRVFAGQNSLFTAVAPLGLLVLGPLGDMIGPRLLLLVAGAAVRLMLGLFVLTPSVRRLEDGPPARGIVHVIDARR